MMNGKFGRLFVLTWLSVLPVFANACRNPGDTKVIVHRTAPMIKVGETKAPMKQNIVIGSVQAYLIPEGTSASIQTVRQGGLTPLSILTDEEVKIAAPRFRFTGDQVPGPAQLGKKWLYLYAGSFGKSELRLSDPSGWSQVFELGMVYPQPQPTGEPVELAPYSGGDLVSFDVDADRNTLWLSVPGFVKDRWSIVEGADTSFQLMRVEQLAVADGDPDLVGLFLVGSRSLRSGPIRIEGGQAPANVFKLNVRALPSVSC